eukprot:Gb_01649 [translate_table: standard]
MGEDRYPDERISGETEKKRAHIRWNIEEGEKSLEELTKQNQLMRWENTVLSDHLTRLVTRKGSELHLQLEALEGEETENADHASKAHKKNTNAMHLVLPSNNGNNNINSEDVAPPDPRTKQSRMQSMRRESKAAGRRARVTTSPETAVPLSLEEKCEIVEDEIAATREQINKLHIESEQTLDDLRAVVEEAELSIVEIKREQATFQREVMFEAELHNSKYASAERVLRLLQKICLPWLIVVDRLEIMARFFEPKLSQMCSLWEKIKSKRTLIGKLQEKNDILQAQLVEAENQLANKKDLADVLHAVDFDQLTIQNKQLAAKIQDRTHELHRLKAKNNRAAQKVLSFNLINIKIVLDPVTSVLVPPRSHLVGNIHCPPP